jgi:hypothetical protein
MQPASGTIHGTVKKHVSQLGVPGQKILNQRLGWEMWKIMMVFNVSLPLSKVITLFGKRIWMRAFIKPFTLESHLTACIWRLCDRVAWLWEHRMWVMNGWNRLICPEITSTFDLLCSHLNST